MGQFLDYGSLLGFWLRSDFSTAVEMTVLVISTEAARPIGEIWHWQ